MKLLSLARDLQRRKARSRHQCFVAEGVRTVESLLDSSLIVRAALVTDALYSDPRGAALFDRFQGSGIRVETVSSAEFESACETESPQGVLAIAEIPYRQALLPAEHARYLVLDAVQDPGNVGSIIRAAAAFGVTSTFALPGTVDLWNAKVVRSTAGALFMHNALHTTWEVVSSFFAENEVECWAAEVGGKAVDELGKDEVPSRVALVVGNEGAGISENISSFSRTKVAVRIAPSVESLNVAVATGILLHALRM